MSLSFTELVIYHNEFFQHVADIIRPFLLNLRKYGENTFLSWLDVLLDHAVVLEILDYGREISEVFPEIKILGFIVPVQQPAFRKDFTDCIIGLEYTHATFLRLKEDLQRRVLGFYEVPNIAHLSPGSLRVDFEDAVFQFVIQYLPPTIDFIPITSQGMNQITKP